MKSKNIVWECACGYIQHGDTMPEDCPKCFRVAEFSPVPEDMIEEKEAEHILSMTSEDEDDED
ncbi:hypothetical protein HY450_03085 [Candidatus Pacearchaeota archaeon]|nr:hypothetical protein [Candidatus Pacearchaeota archaeon]